MTERAKCADLIESRLRETMEELRNTLKKENGDTREEWSDEEEDYVDVDDFPEDTESLDEYLQGVLSISASIEVDIQLSWGGPADGFKIHLDSEGGVEDGYYYYADWFDYAERKLHSDELDDVERVFGGYLEGYRLNGGY